MNKHTFYESVKRRKQKAESSTGGNRYYVKRVGLGERLDYTARGISDKVYTLRAWSTFAVCDRGDDDRLVVYLTKQSVVFALHDKQAQAERHIQRLEEGL